MLSAGDGQHARIPGVLIVLPLELVDEVRHHPAVNVLLPKVRVARGRRDLENAVVNRQQRDIKRPTDMVEDQDVPLALRPLVKAGRTRSRRRLVDDPHDVQASNQASFLRRLPLRVVVVRRARDDRVLLLIHHERLRCLTHLRQHHRRDLRREPLRLPLELNQDQRLVTVATDNFKRPVFHVLLDNRVREPPPDQALRVEDRVLDVHRDQVLRRVPDHPLVRRERDVRRDRPVALVVGDDLDAPVWSSPTHECVGHAQKTGWSTRPASLGDGGEVAGELAGCVVVVDDRVVLLGLGASWETRCGDRLMIIETVRTTLSGGLERDAVDDDDARPPELQQRRGHAELLRARPTATGRLRSTSMTSSSLSTGLRSTCAVRVSGTPSNVPISWTARSTAPVILTTPMLRVGAFN